MKNRLLLVDDDPAVRESLTNVLIGEGYEVVPVANGIEVTDTAASQPVDLVLLDLISPGGTGGTPSSL